MTELMLLAIVGLLYVWLWGAEVRRFFVRGIVKLAIRQVLASRGIRDVTFSVDGHGRDVVEWTRVMPPKTSTYSKTIIEDSLALDEVRWVFQGSRGPESDRGGGP